MCSVVSDSFAPPWSVAHQAPLSMGFSRQEHWSGLPLPPLRGSFQPRDWTCVSCISCIGRRNRYHCVTWKTRLHGVDYQYLHSLMRRCFLTLTSWNLTVASLLNGGISSLDHTLPSSFASLLCLN